MQVNPLLLLVEDEAIIAVALEAQLVEARFDVLIASSGDKAIAELEAGEPGRFAGVLTDIRLPAVDGWTVAKRARELVPAMPRIYMSGDSAADWSAYGVPGSVMLAKPFAAAQLITAIATLLNGVVSHLEVPPHSGEAKH